MSKKSINKAIDSLNKTLDNWTKEKLRKDCKICAKPISIKDNWQNYCKLCYSNTFILEDDLEDLFDNCESCTKRFKIEDLSPDNICRKCESGRENSFYG